MILTAPQTAIQYPNNPIYNLNYCVSAVRMDLSKWTTDDFQKILQYAIWGHGQLKLKASEGVSVLYATPNAAYVIPWPADYQYYTKIGINICGRIINLALNPNLPLTRKEDCSGEISAMVTGCCNQTVNANNVNDFPLAAANWGYWYAPHWRNGQYVGEFYGRGGGTDPAMYFREDKERRRFVFQNVPRTELYIEYVSNAPAGGHTIINKAAIFPIREYMHWELKRFDKKKWSSADVVEQKQLSDKLTREFKIDQVLGFSNNDFLDACYYGFKSNKI